MRMLLSFQRPSCLFGEDIPGEDCLARRPKTPSGRTKDYSAMRRGWQAGLCAGPRPRRSGRPARLSPRSTTPESADRQDLDPVLGVCPRAGVEHNATQKLGAQLVAKLQQAAQLAGSDA